MRVLLSGLHLFFFLSSAYAQINTFNHAEESIVTFQKIHFWGVRDNTDGVFAKPIFDQTLESLNQQKQIAIVNSIEKVTSPFLLKDIERKKLISENDGAIWGEILKQGSIFKLRFSLFDRNGQLFLDAEKILESELNVKKLAQETKSLIAELFGKLPYQGWIIGKKGRLVTLNYGRNQGAKPGDKVDVVLVINITRHPIEHFATEFEKRFIGKILIQKVDDDLSFGSIVSERNPGIIQVGSKIEAQRSVTYPALIKTQDGQLIDTKFNPSEEKLIVGQMPSEWHQSGPQFGFLGFQFGVLENLLNQNLANNRTASGRTPLLPSLGINSELWVTSKLSIDLNIQQSIGTLGLSGPISNSRLNYSENMFKLGAQYRFSFLNDPTQSYFFLGGRLFQFRNSIQETASFDLTSHVYSGLAAVLGMRFAFPHKRLALLTHMELPVFTNSAESPVTSGASAESSRSNIGISGEYFLTPSKSVQMGWQSELFSTTYSGNGSRPNAATHASQQRNSIMIGMNYYY